MTPHVLTGSARDPTRLCGGGRGELLSLSLICTLEEMDDKVVKLRQGGVVVPRLFAPREHWRTGDSDSGSTLGRRGSSNSELKSHKRPKWSTGSFELWLEIYGNYNSQVPLVEKRFPMIIR